jgi:hypothetical protein
VAWVAPFTPLRAASRHGPEPFLRYLDAAWADCVVSVYPELRFFMAKLQIRSFPMKDKYEVGYGKPPKATRFGNRPQPNRSSKSGPARGAAINVAAAINRPMKVVHRGAAVRIHPHEALMQGLAKSGLSGKLGAIKEFLLECKKAGLLDAPLSY